MNLFLLNVERFLFQTVDPDGGLGDVIDVLQKGEMIMIISRISVWHAWVLSSRGIGIINITSCEKIETSS